MADPRFYDNRGPFSLGEVCAKIGVAVPDGSDPALKLDDVARLSGAVASHLSFFLGDKLTAAFAQTTAGVVLVSSKAFVKLTPPDGTVLIAVPQVQHAFAAVAEMFYPDCHRITGPFNTGVDPTAKIGAGVLLGAGVVTGLVFGLDAVIASVATYRRSQDGETGRAVLLALVGGIAAVICASALAGSLIMVLALNG